MGTPRSPHSARAYVGLVRPATSSSVEITGCSPVGLNILLDAVLANEHWVVQFEFEVRIARLGFKASPTEKQAAVPRLPAQLVAFPTQAAQDLIRDSCTAPAG